ncbi:Opacity protein [Poseidonocella pacifica]|uniref:Opacity protein n=1 Tax=Poseidonocella pacifica TaxID=871651 RepID=A0A1I0VPF0_9RHOB|nr:porin family protein [Poseidonocella pacifica]SFA78244.1 Opacity protein [Poseidonocella pacifica]
MKKFSIALALATTALAAPAFAGSLAEPQVEPVPMQPAAPVIASTDWTGFYAGGQIGTLNAEIDDTDFEGDSETYGIHAGYNYDLGNFVVGGELDWDSADADLEDGASAGTIESIARAKLKAGYDAGPALIYATAGAAQMRLDDTAAGLDDTQTGSFYGAGVSYMATDSILVGGEVLKHDFNDLDDVDVDADATTFSLRASYKF